MHEWVPFRLATVVSSNPINFINAYSLCTPETPLNNNRCIVKNYMDYCFTNCGKPKWHSFMSSLSWKGKIWDLNHCLTYVPLENKLLNQNWWSWYHFSKEKVTSYTDTSYCNPHIVGSMPFHFSGPPCIKKHRRVPCEWFVRLFL